MHCPDKNVLTPIETIETANHIVVELIVDGFLPNLVTRSTLILITRKG